MMSGFTRFTRNRLAFAGGIVVLVLFCASVLAPVISPCNPTDINVNAILSPPGPSHLFGTDELGRDVFSRMLYGARISLKVGFVAVGIAVVIGIIVGALAGFYGGWVDSVLMRFVDMMLCFPSFFLILAVIAILEPSIYNIMAVIGITSWMGVARLVRAEFMRIREMDYVKAAKSMGASDKRIIFLHILPNALSPVLVAATLGVAGAILTESALSFLGIGIQEPLVSWGFLMKNAQSLEVLGSYTWVLSPVGFIIFAVLGFNFLGDGLRDAADPYSIV